MAETTPTTRKRSSPDSSSTLRSSDTTPAKKKRKIHHAIRNAQRQPPHTEPAPQDPVFVQAQLLRSIASALVLAGFDSAKPSALEMFRGAVEEYMTRFLDDLRTTMSHTRRTSPTPLDFAYALSLHSNTSHASLLKPQLDLHLPANQSIPPPSDAPPAPPPDFSTLLQPLAPERKPGYVPKHFPPLPPLHAWKRTPDVVRRETERRVLRERAVEEGVLAEMALRRLAAKGKGGRTETGGHGIEKGRGNERWKDAFGDMIKEIGGADEGMGGVDGEGEDEGNVMVNWDVGGWRRGGRRREVRA